MKVYHFKNSFKFLVSASLILSCLIFASCGSSRREKSLKIADSLSESFSPYRIKPYTSKKPFIYRIYSPEGEELPVFMTTLEECDEDLRISTAALTRQLFVGLQNMEVKEQKTVREKDPSILLSVLNGRMEGVNIYIKSLSHKDSGCVKDMVIWSKDNEKLETIDDSLLIKLSESIFKK